MCSRPQCSPRPAWFGFCTAADDERRPQSHWTISDCILLRSKMSMNVTRTCCLGRKLNPSVKFLDARHSHVPVRFLVRRTRSHWFPITHMITRVLRAMRSNHVLSSPLARCRYVIYVAINTTPCAAIFSEFTFAFTFAIYVITRPSVVCLSVTSFVHPI